jgi:hypothetical protein
MPLLLFPESGIQKSLAAGLIPLIFSGTDLS